VIDTDCTRKLITKFTVEKVLERIERKSVVDPVTGCWNWTGALCGPSPGYAAMDTLRVHRATYEIFVGHIPKGLELDHLCRNTKCINPYHLEAVTHRENVLRGTNPAAINGRKTHCINGHPLEGPHIYMWRNRRKCRLCEPLKYQKKIAKWKARTSE
jgi:hypothetical protein